MTVTAGRHTGTPNGVVRSRPLAGPRSLALPFARDMAILVGAAAVIVALGRAAPIEAQPTVWLVAGLALGLLAALGGSWLGLLFLLAGLTAGAILDLATQQGTSARAAEQLSSAGPSYAATGVVAAGAFALMLLALRQFGRA